MDRFTATVRIAGQIDFTAEKVMASYAGLVDEDGEQRPHEVRMPGVTVSEIVVLRHVHGDDAVINITKVNPEAEVRIVDFFNDGTEKTRFVPHTEITVTIADELARLRQIYGATVVAALWPGATPRLPDTFKDAGIENITVGEFVPTVSKKGKKAPPVAKAKEVAAKTNDVSGDDMDKAA